MNKDEFLASVRVVPNYPKPGVRFIDLTPVLSDYTALGSLHQGLFIASFGLLSKPATLIVALDARGFLFATPLAQRLGVGVVMARKAGKLPPPCLTAEVNTEYSTYQLAIEQGAVRPNDRVIIVDDVIATGGTLSAVASILDSIGVAEYAALSIIDLQDLHPVLTLKYKSLYKL